MARVDVDDMIVRLLNVGVPGCSLVNNVKEAELMTLCQSARQVFLSQASLLEVQSPIKICGDIHGQYADVLRLFDRGGFPPMVNYLFLGDYVDRGHQNLECIALFFSYKIKYPGNFFILRGNHECAPINRVYGFFEECNRRYNSTRLWLGFQEAFSTMPFTGLVAGKILCMHGGLSPKVRTKCFLYHDPLEIYRIRKVVANGSYLFTSGTQLMQEEEQSDLLEPYIVLNVTLRFHVPSLLKSLDQLRQITRPIDPPNPSLHIDLLWSDPDHYVKVVQDGYEFFANKRLVTIFSAPHYCGQFDNAAAMMNVDEGLVCSFQILRPTIKANKVVARSS
ncbi:unnamed protein product [Nippostrongylus brasiliensis]|uniref:Serine/threonine-protein phosphatase n=1 Tax=Nippostrongylus brasiliensis TaxID=27835 RepID=A0A0N4YKR6_NIPBR|nr:unnamed protein product [Nippostrongylus brasiliensis]